MALASVSVLRTSAHITKVVGSSFGQGHVPVLQVQILKLCAGDSQLTSLSHVGISHPPFLLSLGGKKINGKNILG